MPKIRWWIYGGIVACVVASTFGLSGANAETSAGHENFKVLSYNVWGAPFAGKKAGFRIPMIAKQLRGIGADVVALQEVFTGCFSSNKEDWVLRDSGYPYYTVGKGPAAFPKCLSSGLMILSKFPILGSASMAYRNCAGMDCFSRKGIVYARILTPNFGEVDFYTTHTNAEQKFDEVRVKQARQAVDFIRKYSGDGKRPVFFVGDFNADANAEEMTNVIGSLALRDSYPEYMGPRDVPEVEKLGLTADFERNGNVKANEPKLRLDYILFRAAQIGSPLQVAVSKLMFEAPDYRAKPLSDHFGVLSEFSAY